MASIKTTPLKKKRVDDNQIIALYMIYVLENDSGLHSVYRFCKQNEIEESDFYSFFGSLESIRQIVWTKFFENVVDTISKDEGYSSYSDKNKLLTLYFSIFEILTLNRSYIIYNFNENHQGFKYLKDLKQFRNQFKIFVEGIIEDSESQSIDKLNKITKPVFTEGAWIQFLLILKFWVKDVSKGFEKTDIVIEKSVNAVVDLFDTKPLENLIDLGKFLWKERKM